jgi:hypothetical protein
MTQAQKEGVKQAARDLYRARRITLETAMWAMKNAGYTREETAEWLGLEIRPRKRTGGMERCMDKAQFETLSPMWGK